MFLSKKKKKVSLSALGRMPEVLFLVYTVDRD